MNSFPCPPARDAVRRVVVLKLVVWALVALAALSGGAHGANSPFGVGLPEAAPPASGPFAAFFAYVAAKQAEFYRALTGAVEAMKTDGSAFRVLAGLSFVYGIFHAAGPGHGKAILSSYLLATGQTARRGILLALASSLAQAVSAVALVGVAAIVLRMTSIAMTDTTRVFEIGSYGLIVALGLWLVWTRVLGHGHHHHHHDHAHEHDHDHGHCTGHDHHHVHEHGHDHGHRHHPEPTELGGDDWSWRQAASVIVSIGLRPCTGALIVLVFALSQGLFFAGVASTFVMALGTSMTVAALALIAVGARSVAVRLAGGHSAGLAEKVHRLFEIAASIAVLLLGVVLLIAALGWGG